MTKPTREEVKRVNARAYRAINMANRSVQTNRIVRLRAAEARNAIREMFAQAAPALARKTKTDRAAWDTRKRLLMNWLEAIAERGI